MTEGEPNCFAKSPPSAISLNGIADPLPDHETAARSTPSIGDRIERDKRGTPTPPIAPCSLELFWLAEAVGALHGAESPEPRNQDMQRFLALGSRCSL